MIFGAVHQVPSLISCGPPRFLPISRTAKCPIAWGGRGGPDSAVMIACEAIITLEDKLDVIQRLDRRWHSLSDKICCTRCGKIFPVREIAVLGGSRAFGPLRLHCPNEDCLATPGDWRECSADNERSAPAKSSFAGDRRACLVERMKRIGRRGEAANTWLKKPAECVAATLHRLDGNWMRFWANLG
jgi:hypothetical protein